jgi:NTE family protein
MWNPVGPEPGSIWDGIDLGGPSSAQGHSIFESNFEPCGSAKADPSHASRDQPAARLSDDDRDSDAVKELVSRGSTTRMHVVQLLAPWLSHENHTKDIDFSRSGIRPRWEAGLEHTKHMLEKKPWEGEFDPLEGVILHQRTMD